MFMISSEGVAYASRFLYHFLLFWNTAYRDSFGFVAEAAEASSIDTNGLAAEACGAVGTGP